MNPVDAGFEEPRVWILRRLAGFVGHLRRQGLAVGVGAEVDLGRALRLLPVLDAAAFREACRTTLAKSPADLAILEEAFGWFWDSSPESEDREDDIDSEPVPRNPPADGLPSDRSRPLTLGRGYESPRPLGVGLYSPDAPSPGHPLSLLEPRDLLALRMGARRFRRKVAALPGRRAEGSRHGKIDFPATARASLRHGGEWVVFRRHRRKLLRTELIILWDVSGSMREHDSHLFGLVYALHRASPRSRVFAFSTDLQDITGGLRGRAYPRAARAVLPALDTAGGGTRIGSCLHEFRGRYGLLVRPETTLVIVSDGWDRDETRLLADELRRLHRLADRVAWVSPYAAKEGFEPLTSGITSALPHVDLLLAPEDFESRGPMRNRA